jgi:hypothetical protein
MLPTGKRVKSTVVDGNKAKYTRQESKFVGESLPLFARSHTWRYLLAFVHNDDGPMMLMMLTWEEMLQD